jgi:hypothetical protein
VDRVRVPRMQCMCKECSSFMHAIECHRRSVEPFPLALSGVRGCHITSRARQHAPPDLVASEEDGV